MSIHSCLECGKNVTVNEPFCSMTCYNRYLVIPEDVNVFIAEDSSSLDENFIHPDEGDGVIGDFTDGIDAFFAKVPF